MKISRQSSGMKWLIAFTTKVNTDYNDKINEAGTNTHDGGGGGVNKTSDLGHSLEGPPNDSSSRDMTQRSKSACSQISDNAKSSSFGSDVNDEDTHCIHACVSIGLLQYARQRDNVNTKNWTRIQHA